MKAFLLSLLVIIFGLSGCQPPALPPESQAKKTVSITSQLQTPSNTKNVSIEDICSTVYRNHFEFGSTTLDEATHYLYEQQIDNFKWTDAHNPALQFIRLTDATNDLVFHNGTLIAEEIGPKAKNAYTLGQIVTGLGEPEYYNAGLAVNATPVGACEDQNCTYFVEIEYPSLGVSAGIIGGTTAKEIIISGKMRITDITCYEPGQKAQYEQYRYGFVYPQDKGKEWPGFGTTVVLRD